MSNCLEKDNGRSMKQIGITIGLLLIWAVVVQAQNERKFVRQGNKYYLEALKNGESQDTVLFNKSEIEYRKALEKKPENNQWKFNMADAIYKQHKFEESAEKFKEIAERTLDKVDKSRALHNLGNSLLMNNKIDESIDAYKEALRNNPGDLETKYNLLYAMDKKKQQQQQQQQQQNQDQNKDKNKDQKKNQNQDQKDQNKDQNQQNKDEQPQESKISKQNAEQMLQALENNEKKIQDKVKKMQALKAESRKVEKDW